jgi:hypothetical protein
MPDPVYTFGAEDEALEFVSPSPVGDDWCVVDLKGHILYRVTAAEAVTMERAGLVGPAGAGAVDPRRASAGNALTPLAAAGLSESAGCRRLLRWHERGGL